jgi:hypothetical protein
MLGIRRAVCLVGGVLRTVDLRWFSRPLLRAADGRMRRQRRLLRRGLPIWRRGKFTMLCARWLGL